MCGPPLWGRGRTMACDFSTKICFFWTPKTALSIDARRDMTSEYRKITSAVGKLGGTMRSGIFPRTNPIRELANETIERHRAVHPGCHWRQRRRPGDAAFFDAAIGQRGQAVDAAIDPPVAPAGPHLPAPPISSSSCSTTPALPNQTQSAAKSTRRPWRASPAAALNTRPSIRLRSARRPAPPC